MPRPTMILAALMGSTMFTAAAAQETVDLGEIVFEVEGAEAVGDNPAPFTLTGVKTATDITEVPQSVSVIGRETFERQQPAKVDEILKRASGVQPALYGYDSDTNWFYIRGFAASDTGAFLDGLSLFSYGFGTFYIDPFLLERVEVLKGPSSMLYGASSPGGLVNSVSRFPDGGEGGALTFGADTEGRLWSSAEVEGIAGADTSFRFGAKVTRQDGHGMLEEGIEGVLFGGVTRAFEDGGRLTLHLSYTNMQEDHVGGQFLHYFGTEAAAPYGRLDEYFNAGTTDFDDYDRQQGIFTGIYRRDIAGWELTDTFRLGIADIAENWAYPYGYGTGQVPTPGANLSLIAFAHDSRATIAQNDLRMTREFSLGATTHDVLAGLDLRRYRLDETQASLFLPGEVDPTDPDNDLRVGPLPAPYIDGVRVQEQAGLYLQDQIRFGDGWIATLNGRYDVVESSLENDIGADLERTDRQASGRAAISKRIGEVTAYATAGTYFNPQVLNLGALDADPETGRQYEVGVKWQPTERSLITLAAFDILRRDVSQEFVNGGQFDTRILGEVRSRGVEIEADTRIGEAFRLNADLTLMEVEIEDFDGDRSFIGKTPESVVEDLAGVQLAYTGLAGAEFRVGARYIGDSWADNQNTLKVDGVTLFNAGVSYEFADGWVADANVNNIADERYTGSCETGFGVSSCFQGEGRTATFAITRSF